MREDLISRKSLLQKLDLFNDRENGNKHFLLGIETAKEVIGDEPAAFDEENVINKIKELKKRYFLTIANTGDEKLDFSYTAVANTLDQVIEIIEKG